MGGVGDAPSPFAGAQAGGKRAFRPQQWPTYLRFSARGAPSLRGGKRAFRPKPWPMPSQLLAAAPKAQARSREGTEALSWMAWLNGPLYLGT